MFCPNCGNNCGDANFCSECGQDLREVKLGEIQNFAVTESMRAKTSEVEKADAPGFAMPNPPIGRYENLDREYIELDESSVTFYKKPILMKATKRTIPYGSVKAVAYMEGVKFRTGGFLSIQEQGNSENLKTTVQDAVTDERSISFSWKENADFLKVYEFLKNYADKAIKNHQAEKWSTPAKQMMDDAVKARRYEEGKDYVLAQTIASAPETFDVDKLAWYPGKKKDDRKAKIAELDKSGQVYCPKCLSTSITANQKGFGFGRGAIGAAVGLDVGLIAGGIGSKKVICTCLKCGYQWKAGKK